MLKQTKEPRTPEEYWERLTPKELEKYSVCCRAGIFKGHVYFWTEGGDKCRPFCIGFVPACGKCGKAVDKLRLLTRLKLDQTRWSSQPAMRPPSDFTVDVWRKMQAHPAEHARFNCERIDGKIVPRP